MKHRRARAGSVLLLSGVLAAAGAAPALASGHHSAKPKPSGTVIATRTIAKLGKVLTNAKGDVLYASTNDGHGVSHCTGGCLAVWPRVTSVKAAPRATAGVKAAHLGRTSAAKHSQVTYFGRPLYSFTGDSAPGKATGEGDASFYVVSTGGKIVKPAPATTPSAPSSPYTLAP